MWDQRAFEGGDTFKERIIPTYVGSTACMPDGKQGLANHSHVCGINPCFLYNLRSRNESFPRMWDQLSMWIASTMTRRIIPTYVGST